MNMRQETDGVLLECFLIYEPEHQATWFKEQQPLLGELDYDARYQVRLDRSQVSLFNFMNRLHRWCVKAYYTYIYMYYTTYILP